LHDMVTPLLTVKMNAELISKYLPAMITALQENSLGHLLPEDDNIIIALAQAPSVIVKNAETALKKHRQLSNTISAAKGHINLPPSLNNGTSAHHSLVITSKIKNILLVEDEIIHQDIGISLLSLRFKLECANNGLEAIEKCKQKKYDLILMDLQMPKMNGVQATEELRKFIHKDTVIVGLTSMPLGNKHAELTALGFNAFLEKPLKLESFKYLLESDSAREESTS
jgi:CheY-like chemotaxis protein